MTTEFEMQQCLARLVKSVAELVELVERQNREAQGREGRVVQAGDLTKLNRVRYDVDDLQRHMQGMGWFPG